MERPCRGFWEQAQQITGSVPWGHEHGWSFIDAILIRASLMMV